MLKKLCALVFFSAASLFCQFPNDDVNRYLLGESFDQAGSPEKAKVILEDLYKRNPSNIQYFNALNRVYISLKMYDASVKLLTQHLIVTPDDINTYGLLGSTWYLAGDENKAFSVWEEGLTKVPPNPMNFRLLANYAIERRAFDKAVDFLKRGKKITDNPLFFSYDLANLYSITMQYKDAAEEYLFIVIKTPDQFQAVQQRILSYINKVDALKTTIAVFEKNRDNDNINLSYILASLYLMDKSYDKAYDVYVEIDSKLKTGGVELLNFAQNLFNEHQFQLASGVYNDIINKYPSSPVVPGAKLGYAKSLEALLDIENDESNSWQPFRFDITGDPKKINKVVDAFNEIVKIFPHSEPADEALLRIGSLQSTRLNDIVGAKKIFNSLISDAPNSSFSIKAYEELGNIYLCEGNLQKSREMFEFLTSANIPEEEKNYARFRLGRILFYEGNFPAARDMLLHVVTNYKDNYSNEALETSLFLNTMMNDSSNLVIFASAEFLSEEKKFSDARVKYLVVSQNQQAFVLQSLAKLRVAEMDIALNSYDSSIKLLLAIADEKEKNIYSDKALYLLGNIYQFGKKDSPRAIEAYESLLAKFPNSIYLDKARDLINNLKNKLS
jgi:tetratricopeptide (TPR) repeat protein